MSKVYRIYCNGGNHWGNAVVHFIGKTLNGKMLLKCKSAANCTTSEQCNFKSIEDAERVWKEFVKLPESQTSRDGDRHEVKVALTPNSDLLYKEVDTICGKAYMSKIYVANHRDIPEFTNTHDLKHLNSKLSKAKREYVKNHLNLSLNDRIKMINFASIFDRNYKLKVNRNDEEEINFTFLNPSGKPLDLKNKNDSDFLWVFINYMEDYFTHLNYYGDNMFLVGGIFIYDLVYGEGDLSKVNLKKGINIDSNVFNSNYFWNYNNIKSIFPDEIRKLEDEFLNSKEYNDIMSSYSDINDGPFKQVLLKESLGEKWKQNLQHILEVEFTTTDYPTRRSYLTTDGKFISTPHGKDPHYVLDNFIANTITGIMGTNYEEFKNCPPEEIEEYLSKYNLTLEDIKEIDSHLNYSNMGHNCGSPELERNLNLIRLNGGVHGECYMLLPSTPINNIQLNQLEKWLDKFFYQPIEIDWDDGDGNLDISQYISMLDNNYEIYKPTEYSPKNLINMIRGTYNGIYHRMNEDYDGSYFDINKLRTTDDKYVLQTSLDFIKDNALREQIKKANKFLTSTPLVIFKRIWTDLSHKISEKEGFSFNLNSASPLCFEIRYNLKGIQMETINHEESFITLTLMLHPLTPTIYFTFWNCPPYMDLIERVFKNPNNMRKIGDAFKSHIIPVLKDCVDVVTPARTQVSLR